MFFLLLSATLNVFSPHFGYKHFFTHIEINFGFKISVVIDEVLNIAIMGFKIQMTLGLHLVITVIIIFIIIRLLIRIFGFLVRISRLMIWLF